MDLAALALQSLVGSVKITLIIFALMVVVELLVLKYRERILRFTTTNRFTAYLVASFFGIIPGCVGTFAMDTLYMSGLLGFGGIIAVMIATSGDEMFIMLSMMLTGELPFWSVALLVATLFVLGVLGGWLADALQRRFGWQTCAKCHITHHEHDEFRISHFLTEHVYKHILKRHLWQIFLWLYAALFLIQLVSQHLAAETLFSGAGLAAMLVLAALVGLLPISGPNVFLLALFAHGYLPFSILLANSIVQDGHGLLPIIGFSLDDALKIKLYNFLFGLAVGALLLLAGL